MSNKVDAFCMAAAMVCCILFFVLGTILGLSSQDPETYIYVTILGVGSLISIILFFVFALRLIRRPSI